MKILLVGNPNVGKSVLFSRLTGARVIASNYPGTTVHFTKGYLRNFNIRAEIIDAPGTYTLSPTNKAEEVTLNLVEEADVIINVIDATNLERNLLLTMEIISKINKPMIIALNMWDETRHRGIEIDIRKLEEVIGVDVVAVCGLSGEGIRDLVSRIEKARRPRLEVDDKSRWVLIGKIVEESQRLYHHHHSLRDVLEEISIRPPWAYIIAVVMVFLSFQVVRFIGEGLINFIFDPFFQNIYKPLILRFSDILMSHNFLHSILIGDISGEFDYAVAFGVLTTGLYVPFAMVLPYVFSFYLVLGLLEDWGYLPRLAVLSDRLFHKVGLHGYSVVPMVLGLGCNVPGALATRLFDERKEKFIVATLLAIAVPCMAQTSMIIGILGRFGGQFVAIVFFNLVVVWFILGRILNRFLKGQSPEILMEIPPYRMPSPIAMIKKMWIRLSAFFKEAVPYVLVGVLLVNILYYLKIIDFFAVLFSPVLKNVWGLPQRAIGALIVGFLRKDVAVGMLRPLNLTVRQLIVGSTVLAIYFPCVATFFVLVRELGLKDMFKSICIMVVTAIIVGGTVNMVLLLLGIG